MTDREPGIRRARKGRGFIYLDSTGRRVTDPKVLTRIRKLAIPPAYKDVWICEDASGHLQATGRDARGRKQYRYHADWRSRREADKFDRMLEFGRALPRVHRSIAADLRKPGLPREKVLAAIVRLLETTLVRIGNEEYARTNGSFGLTTLRDRHVDIDGETMRFEFRGKSGIVHRLSIDDPVTARIVRRCQELPGQELFQWVDADGVRRRIDSSDVNEYIRRASGSDFTAKDFRTWFATVHALELLRARELTAETDAARRREAQRVIVQTVSTVARRLGNTPTVCRKSYIHPVVLVCYAEGRIDFTGRRSAVDALRALLGKLGRKQAAGGRSRRPRRQLSDHSYSSFGVARRRHQKSTDSASALIIAS